MLMRQKYLADRAGLNRLRRATYNGDCLTATPHCLNGTELSREEFQDNILLQYGIVLLNLPTECDCCSKRLLVTHDLSCPKGGLVLEWHNDAAKEWGTFLAWALNISCISYEPKTNSRTLQGKRNRARAKVETGTQEGGVN